MTTTTRTALLALLALLTLSLVPGCGDELAVKLGTEGELCVADNDCRDELICVRRECAPLTNFTSSCGGVCDYIDACNISEPGCVEDCQSESRNWTAPGKERVFQCLLDLSCGQLGQAEFYDGCKALR